MSNENKKTDQINWIEFQKNYLDTLMSFNPIPHKNPLEKSFWNNAMEYWWKSIKSDSTFEHDALFENIINQCRNYSFMGDQFSSLIEGMANFKDNKDVGNFINKKFKDIEGMFSQTPVNFSWSSFVDACEMPYEAMKNYSSMNIFGLANLADGFNPELKSMRDQFLSIPGIGHTRETQDKLKKLLKLWAAYQDNYNEHQSVMSQLNHDALEMMRKKILTMSKKGNNFDSMKHIYDLWVESNEKVYGDYACKKEFSELNGRLVNSQMAFRKLSQEVNEDLLTAMNMPTNRAINVLERRHYELNKKVKSLELELKKITKIIGDKGSETKTKPVSITKKKTTKKKVSKKKLTKKAQPKKKAKKKSRSTKSDVIEIKF